jgi:YegS/Rv2252/BmrU family lipid kinase
VAQAVLITNPIAARTHPAVAQAVSRVFRASGWGIEVRETSAPGDAHRFATEAVTGGTDVVAVFGGDGTTIQAARALVGSEVALGLVPGGTGNVLAGNLRVPTSPVAAAELIIRGGRRRIDLGRLDREDGSHYFGVACGAGADARIMGGTRTAEKRRWGIGGYFATMFRMLPRIRSSIYRITLDGRPIEFRASVAMVLNCGELIPPLVRIRRGARPDDGLLDLVAVSADSLWQCARGALRAIQNVYLGTGETAYLIYGQGEEITIETAEPEPVQYDGDVMGITPVTATVVPGAISIVAPRV